jgi:hypothetical protein
VNSILSKDFRKNRLSNSDHIKELKYKILRDKALEKRVQHIPELPPHMKKRNRRYKSIYEAMHMGDHEKNRNNMLKSRYGHLEYQQFVAKNEIPDDDYLVQVLKKSLTLFGNDHKHHKKHHNTRSHQRIKKLRSKPEAGIMQKKLKV